MTDTPTEADEEVAPEWGHIDSYDQNALRPKIGTHWVWEPHKSHVREVVVVTGVRWNGEEWWIETESLAIRDAGLGIFHPDQPAERKAPPERHWNDLSRFMEACRPIGTTIEALAAVTERGTVDKNP